MANIQLHTLQEQINPHFMFNVLNHIYMLMQKDVESASSLLLQYSDILRYQLYSGKQEYISVEQEIEFLQNFITIEKNRWKNQITVECNWCIDNQEKKIPPLLFITFIENAFKHVERTVNRTGYVNISLEQNEDTIHLTVENSKHSQPTRKRIDSGLGLKNIRKRLNILYPQKHKLHIVNVDDSYKVELLINLD